MSVDMQCINTIRTLSMDAVQKANSGHPGTPMALAPVAYALWQDVLRFDPAGPDLAQPRPLRALRRPRQHVAVFAAAPDRHAQARPGRAARRGGGDARRHQAVPPTVQRNAGPPRVQPDLRRRNHDRAARPGRRQLGGHGDGRALVRRPLQPPGLPALRLPRLRPVRRRRHDGRRLRRGGERGRAPQALEPRLDLRQQPHHHRRRDGPRLQRAGRHALRGLRLETSCTSTTPTTPRA